MNSSQISFKPLCGIGKILEGKKPAESGKHAPTNAWPRRQCLSMTYSTGLNTIQIPVGKWFLPNGGVIRARDGISTGVQALARAITCKLLFLLSLHSDVACDRSISLTI